jgi:hypothetical protein
MRDVELSGSIAGSGSFIELHRSGRLTETQALWVEYDRVRKEHYAVIERLRMCNDRAWLFHFAGTCKRQNRDFEKELRRKVDDLEKIRCAIEKREGDIGSALRVIDPALVEPVHTLVGARLLQSVRNPDVVPRKSGDAVLRRNGIIARYPKLNSFDLCKRFELEPIPIPESWPDKFPSVHSWISAYENKACRPLIHKMISDARHRLRLP